MKTYLEKAFCCAVAGSRLDMLCGHSGSEKQCDCRGAHTVIGVVLAQIGSSADCLHHVSE